MRRHSLTARLTAYFSLSSAAMLLGLGILIALAMEEHFAVEDFTALGENVNVIRRVVESSSAPEVSSRLNDVLQHRTDLIVRVQAPQGQALFATPDFDFAEVLAVLRKAGRHSGALVWQQGDKQYRGVHMQVPLRDDGALDVLVGINTEIHAHFLRAFRKTLTLYIALAALASGLFGWWAARRGLLPLRAMASRAKSVTADRLDERMPVDMVPVEVADLGVTLNGMLARLQGDFQRLTDFSTDIAHELRTPITNLLTQTEVALSQIREPAKYRDVLASNVEELQRLARMVSDMLYLAKMEHNLTLPSAEMIELAGEVRALFEFYDAFAEDKAVQLQVEGQAQLRGDRLMLRRAFSNLLSNAIRHTPRRGRVIVSITPTEEGLAVTIDNDGEAIAHDVLPFIFERFFRADKSRARPESDGAGLGLAITKAIVLAHGGTISATRVHDRTRFTVRLPIRC